MKLRERISYANVVATLALFLAIGGVGYAATKLPKNSVGTKQIKKNAVTGAKVKKHTLTGKNINLKKLGTVPSASSAAVASALTPLEAVHFVGTPGEPPFINGSNVPAGALEPPIPGVSLRPVGFYKDHEGIVHLEGAAVVGTGTPYPIIFTLPAGFRPASKTVLTFPNTEGEEVISIQGSNISSEGHDYSGDVLLYGGGSDNYASLSGITFRAES
jgi:hypothetical protein